MATNFDIWSTWQVIQSVTNYKKNTDSSEIRDAAPNCFYASFQLNTMGSTAGDPHKVLTKCHQYSKGLSWTVRMCIHRQRQSVSKSRRSPTRIKRIHHHSFVIVPKNKQTHPPCNDGPWRALLTQTLLTLNFCYFHHQVCWWHNHPGPHKGKDESTYRDIMSLAVPR